MYTRTPHRGQAFNKDLPGIPYMVMRGLQIDIVSGVINEKNGITKVTKI